MTDESWSGAVAVRITWRKPYHEAKGSTLHVGNLYCGSVTPDFRNDHRAAPWCAWLSSCGEYGTISYFSSESEAKAALVRLAVEALTQTDKPETQP